MIVALFNGEGWSWDIFEDGKRIDSILINEEPLKIDDKGYLYTKADIGDSPVIKRYKMTMN